MGQWAGEAVREEEEEKERFTAKDAMMPERLTRHRVPPRARHIFCAECFL
jgi:hypothetical protein